jgi:peptidoglycan/xylan/chitin deacetylase (PgdA/CDA1 family)
LKINIKIKKALSYPLYYFERAKTHINKYSENNYVILMYHRVIRKNESKLFLQDGMFVDPYTFRMHIEFLKKYFNVIPLHDAQNIKNIKSRRLANKPICVLTFDDGWKDLFYNVFPILKMYEVNATVFLPTGIVGTKIVSGLID